MSTPLLIAGRWRKSCFTACDGEPSRPDHRRHRDGKTVTLQKLAESLSEIGVPVFMADVKAI